MILRFYTRADGVVPFWEWYAGLKDEQTRLRIAKRFGRVRLGNMGDCKSVGGGVWELRLMFGPGFRIYYGMDGKELIVILCGGTKSTQSSDIRAAQTYWQDHLRSKEEKE